MKSNYSKAKQKQGDMVCNDFQLAVDSIIIKNNKILLIKRNTTPFKGKWCLPGGRAKLNELLANAAKREAKEETGIDTKIKKLIGVFDAIKRDPRKRTVSIAYLCEATGGRITKNSEAQDIKWFPINKLPELAFDHQKIVASALGQC